jgi:hypothetical protein
MKKTTLIASHGNMDERALMLSTELCACLDQDEILLVVSLKNERKLRTDVLVYVNVLQFWYYLFLVFLLLVL